MTNLHRAAAGQANSSSKSNGAAQQPPIQPPVLYQPLVHKFKCVGVLRVDDDAPRIPGGGGNDGEHHDSSDSLEDLPLSLCRGISTRLQTVGSLPPARSPEEAEAMFRNAIAPTENVKGVRGDAEEYDRRQLGHQGRVRRIGGGGGGVAPVANNPAAAAVVDDGLGGDMLTCYGTTDVSVLTVQEVPASAMSPVLGGMAMDRLFNPFSILGGVGMPPMPPPGGGGAADAQRDIFGGGGDDASQSRGESPSGNPFAGGGFGPFGLMGGMAGAGGGSYKSVSTTSSIVDGKRVTTKETTTMVNGERKAVKEITTVHRDGRREVATEGDGGGNQGGPDASVSPKSDAGHSPHQAVDPFQQQQPSSPKVLAVMHDCRLGLEVSDSLHGDRRTGISEATVRLGAIGFTMASEYDVIEEEEEMMARDERRRVAEDETSGGAETADAKKSTTRQRNTQHGDDSEDGKMKDPIYYLSRTAQSMERNAKTLFDIVSESDFPHRVVDGGRKVVGNFGRTYERMEKLAGDMYRFWIEDDDEGQNGGGAGGRW